MHFILFATTAAPKTQKNIYSFYNLYNFKTELMTAHLFVEEILMFTLLTASCRLLRFLLTDNQKQKWRCGGLDGVRGCSASLHYHYIIYANYKFITWTTNGCQRHHHHHHRHPLCNKDIDSLFFSWWWVAHYYFSCSLSSSLP